MTASEVWRAEAPEAFTAFDRVEAIAAAAVDEALMFPVRKAVSRLLRNDDDFVRTSGPAPWVRSPRVDLRPVRGAVRRRRRRNHRRRSRRALRCARPRDIHVCTGTFRRRHVPAGAYRSATAVRRDGRRATAGRAGRSLGRDRGVHARRGPGFSSRSADDGVDPPAGRNRSSLSTVPIAPERPRSTRLVRALRSLQSRISSTAC